MSDKTTLGDYDVWYRPCDNCGYDTAKSTKKSIDKCWKCGRKVYRDYSDRALKKNKAKNQKEDLCDE